MAYFYMFKQLWRYAGPERWKVAVYFMLHAIGTLGALGKPFAFAMVVNALQANEPSMVDEILRWLGFYVGCFFVFEIFHRSARYVERFVAFRNRKRFVGAAYDHLQALPLGWHADNHSGAVIDRVNRAADALYRFSETQFNYITVFMQFWGPLIILWQISPVVSLAGLLAGLAMVATTRTLYSLSVPEYRAQNEGFHRVAAALHDYVGNIRTIVTLRLGLYARRDLLDRLDRVFPHIVRENNITHIKCFVSALLVLAAEVGLILYYITDRHSAGALIMIGSVTAIFQYLGQLMASFQFYAGEYEAVIHWKTDFEAVQPILDAKAGPSGALDSRQRGTRWDSLRLQVDAFSYGKDGFGLHDLSLRLGRGQKIAIVGESGSGKSTLLHIMRGLTPVPGATVRYDDADARPVSLLAGQSTLIPQDPEIFENTIRYNVTMGIPAAADEIDAAVSTAGFGEIVDRLPHGLDSDVREKGVNFSGGEKQRLALARGLFAVRDSSLVGVLHRLHLVRLFDYVYVMRQGRLVEEGDFASLRDAGGEFSRLWDKYRAEGDTD